MRSHHPLSTSWPRRGLPAMLGLAALALAGCGANRDASNELSTDSHAPRLAPSSAPASPATLDTRTLGYALGKSYGYTLKLTTAVSFPNGGSYDFDLVGHVVLAPLTVTPEAVMFHVSLSDARIVNRISERQAELDQLAAELRSSPAFFALSGGRVSELRVPPRLSQMAASSYRQVATALQFARAVDGSQRYTTSEYDTTGRYLIEYALGADGTTWHKRKQRYSALLGQEDAPGGAQLRIVPEVVASEGEIRLSPDGRPVNIQLSEQLLVNGAQVPVRSRVGIDLQARTPEPAPAGLEAWVALLPNMKRFEATQPILDGSAARSLDEARIGDLSFETIVARLEQRAGDTDAVRADEQSVGTKPSAAEQAAQEQKVQEEARLFTALAALFRTRPGSIAQAVAAIHAGSPAANVLTDALGSASTREAHKALAKLLGAKAIDPEVQGRLVFALARTPKPTREASLALKSVLLRDPLNAGALYGLGTHARVLRDAGEKADADALGELLIERLKIADGAMAVATVLRAVANSGYDGAFSRVLPYLDDRQERVRVAAVRALQSMRDPRVDGIIAGRLGTDTSNDVRLSAIEAAELREPSERLATALAAAGKDATDPHVRYRAVELMARWLPQRPELRVTLRAVAKNDAEERIRERAEASL